MPDSPLATRPVAWLLRSCRCRRRMQRGHGAGGALALAADHLEDPLLPPVHVHLEVLAERTDPLELFQVRLEALGPRAVRVFHEAFALLALALVDLEHAVDGFRHPLR